MKFFYLLTLLLTIFIFNLQAQKPDSLLHRYNQKSPQEKIHFHFDKEMYVAGESIWFKVYLLSNLIPSNISSSLFVELIDATGRVIGKRTLPVFEGTAAGNLELSDSLSRGYYSIRAYTTWMLNFDKDFIFRKKIYVFNNNSIAALSTVSNDAYTINFFPEGGNLVSGVVNTVAFKATDANGYPVAAKGIVKDSQGNTVTAIKTIHDGMGKFGLFPFSGQEYFAELNFNNGKVATIKLPAPTADGIALYVDDKGGQKRIVLSRLADAKEKISLLLIGQMENDVVFKKEIVIQGQSNIINIPVNALPSGILQITVFDIKDKPLMERIVFINNDEYKLKHTLTTDSFNIGKRAKNAFVFSIADTIDGNYSIAITNEANTAVPDDRDNIISRFLLSSDIKGYVHNPSFYFNNNDKFTKEALDLVMMTNGWRRFKWEQILTTQLPEIKFTPLPYISIRGKVYAANGKDLLRDGDLNFFVKQKADSTSAFFMVPVDTQGNFKIDSLIYTDTARLYFNYNAKKRSKQDVRIKLDQTTIWPTGNDGKILQIFSVGMPIKDSLQTKLLKNREQITYYKDYIKKVVQLKEIKITAKKKSPEQQVNERYTSSIFSSSYGRTIDLINNPVPGASALAFYLQSRIPKINIIGTPGNQQIVNAIRTSIMAGP